MVDMNDLVARILDQRAAIPEGPSLLVGISGIDGSGKGYVAKQIEARLGQHSIAVANINADGWLNLPDTRFNSIEPAAHFRRLALHKKSKSHPRQWVDASDPLYSE
jgi:uridine kinase